MQNRGDQQGTGAQAQPGEFLRNKGHDGDGDPEAEHFMYYNLVRIHQALRITPAMAAGVSDHVWELEEIASLADGNSN